MKREISCQFFRSHLARPINLSRISSEFLLLIPDPHFRSASSMSPWPGAREEICSDGDPESAAYSVSSTSCFESEVSEGIELCDELPREFPDPYYAGPVLNTKLRCCHEEIPVRKVAFDFAATGRKFFGCPRKGSDRCHFVMWVDKPWNPVLTRALLHLWDHVNADSSSGQRIVDHPPDNVGMEEMFEQKLLGFERREAKLKQDLRSPRVSASKELQFYMKIFVSAISVSVREEIDPSKAAADSKYGVGKKRCASRNMTASVQPRPVRPVLKQM